MKPLIVVSRCLGFDNCRYDGTMINDEFIESLKPLVEFRTVCPEIAIGLGVPRDPIRVVKSKNAFRLVQPATGRDITDQMNAFTAGLLRTLTNVDGFILKSRSPSCGIVNVNVYAGIKTRNPVAKNKGFFAAAICDHFPYLPIENERRLKNKKIRGDFLNAIRVKLR